MKTQVIIVGVAILILLAAGFTFWWFEFHRPSPENPPLPEEVSPAPSPILPPRPRPVTPPMPQPITPLPKPVTPPLKPLVVEPTDIVLAQAVSPITAKTTWSLLWNGTAGAAYDYLIKDSSGKTVAAATITSPSPVFSVNDLNISYGAGYTITVSPHGDTGTTITIPSAKPPTIDITTIKPVWGIKSNWLSITGDTDVRPTGGTQTGVDIHYSVNNGSNVQMPQDTCQNSNPVDNMHNGWSCGTSASFKAGDIVSFVVMVYNGDNVASMFEPPLTIKIQ